MAAQTVIEYSITDPRRYFQNNILGGMNLLDAMVRVHQTKNSLATVAVLRVPNPWDVRIVEMNEAGRVKLSGWW